MSDESLLIRRAEADDLHALVELARTTFHDAYRSFDDPADIHDYTSRHFTADTFAAILEDAKSSLFVAQIDRLVGYLHIRHSTPPLCVIGTSPLEVARLYLRQEIIGKKLGARLMQLARDEARRASCGIMWLSVYDKNIRAVEFYKRFGFVDVGTKEFVFGGQTYNDPVMAAAVPTKD